MAEIALKKVNAYFHTIPWTCKHPSIIYKVMDNQTPSHWIRKVAMEARSYTLILILVVGVVAALGPRTCHGSVYKTELAKMSLEKVAKAADGFRKPPVILSPPEPNRFHRQDAPPSPPPFLNKAGWNPQFISFHITNFTSLLLSCLIKLVLGMGIKLVHVTIRCLFLFPIIFWIYKRSEEFHKIWNWEITILY